MNACMYCLRSHIGDTPTCTNLVEPDQRIRGMSTEKDKTAALANLKQNWLTSTAWAFNRDAYGLPLSANIVITIAMLIVH